MLVRYNLPKAIRRLADKRPLEGVEAELQELVATRSHLSFAGNLHVPLAVLRAGTAGDLQSTGVGAAFVPAAADRARLSSRHRPLLDELGVPTVSSEGASLQVPNFTAGSVAIKDEAVAADSSSAAAGSVTLAPQRATASTLVSQQLLIQGGADSVINSIVAELQADIARIIDRTAFNLLVDSINGISTNVFEATAGATAQPLTQDTLDDMLRGAFNQGGDLRNMRYVASPKGFEDIQALQTNNVYSLDKTAEVINAKPFYASKELVDYVDPPDTTSRVVVGDWEQGLLKADFGLLDVGVNAFDLDIQHEVRLTVHQYFDVQIMDESVFSIYREEV
jgi:HK97 family phage major capsid protein